MDHYTSDCNPVEKDSPKEQETIVSGKALTVLFEGKDISTDQDTWIGDTGASNHVTYNSYNFQNVISVTENVT